jgi:hypothetical protein
MADDPCTNASIVLPPYRPCYTHNLALERAGRRHGVPVIHGRIAFLNGVRYRISGARTRLEDGKFSCEFNLTAERTGPCPS